MANKQEIAAMARASQMIKTLRYRTDELYAENLKLRRELEETQQELERANEESWEAWAE